jgi:hypothetical protein
MIYYEHEQSSKKKLFSLYLLTFFLHYELRDKHHIDGYHKILILLLSAQEQHELPSLSQLLLL